MTFQIPVGRSIRASNRYLEGHGFDSDWGSQKILFLSTCISTWKCFFIIYTLSKSPIHLSFIHIYHFDTLSLAVWQDTCHTYKNLVYHLAHHESPRASNRYLEGHGFNSRWGLRKFFFWVFRLENASSLFTLYPSHQSIYHLFTFIILTRWALQYGRTHVTHIRT